MVHQSILRDYIIFGKLKKSKFILKIFLTKVKHYCMKLNYSSTVKSKSPGNEWLEQTEKRTEMKYLSFSGI